VQNGLHTIANVWLCLWQPLQFNNV